MATDRHPLPQLGGDLFLTDGGIETCLIFHEGVDLPLFRGVRPAQGRRRDRRAAALFPLLVRGGAPGRHGLRVREPDLARESRLGRASWAIRPPTGRCQSQRHGARGRAAARDREREHRSCSAAASGHAVTATVRSALMTGKEAQAYHAQQIEALAEGGAEMIAAITMTHAGEAMGIARAAKRCGLPVAISFTVETDGSLPSGQALAEAIADVDAATDGAPAYYMVNCAHPTHFADKLAGGGAWTGRIRGLRANASRCSHAELDDGDRARRRRSRGVRRAVCRAAPTAAAADCARRLLRHRPSPCRGHRARLRPNVAHRGRCLVCAQLLLRRAGSSACGPTQAGRYHACDRF